MMLDEMEPMKFHEIMHSENLLMLYDHLEFQYDISQEMDIMQKKVSLLQKLSEILHSTFECPARISTTSHSFSSKKTKSQTLL